MLVDNIFGYIRVYIIAILTTIVSQGRKGAFYTVDNGNAR